MTIRDIEEDVRTILLDTYEDAYRFVPKEIFKALRDGMKNTRNVRPESRYVSGFLVDLGFPDIPSSFDGPGVLDAFRGNVLNMEDRWREALVYYVVSRMYMKDDADTTNANLVTQYANLYQGAVQS